jgi:hypothetical protein
MADVVVPTVAVAPVSFDRATACVSRGQRSAVVDVDVGVPDHLQPFETTMSAIPLIIASPKSTRHPVELQGRPLLHPHEEIDQATNIISQT